MTLTATHIADVQRTWALCVPIADQAADIFYDRLFSLDASLRELFPQDMKDQKKKLMTMITAAVKGLNDLSTLVPILEALGRRHVGYRVKDSQYATVGSALLFTLEKGLGANWTPPVQQAWTTLYGVIASTMIAAGKK